MHHICYEVDDILAARDRLRATGARVLGDGTPKIGAHVFDTLTTLVRETGLAAVIATHNLVLAAKMDRRVTIREGLVVELD